jgi:hypothetical protein
MTIRDDELMLTLIKCTHRNVVHEPPFVRAYRTTSQPNARGKCCTNAYYKLIRQYNNCHQTIFFFFRFICLVVIYSGVVEQSAVATTKSKCVDSRLYSCLVPAMHIEP